VEEQLTLEIFLAATVARAGAAGHLMTQPEVALGIALQLLHLKEIMVEEMLVK
jgi:hypothetical protein